MGDNTSIISRIASPIFSWDFNRNRNNSSESLLSFNPDYTFLPDFTLEARIYPWKDSRLRKGKRVDYFTGPYLGLPLSVGISRNLRYMAGPMIGLQHTLGRKAYADTQIGYGINGDSQRYCFRFMARIGVGLILN